MKDLGRMVSKLGDFGGGHICKNASYGESVPIPGEACKIRGMGKGQEMRREGDERFVDVYACQLVYDMSNLK